MHCVRNREHALVAFRGIKLESVSDFVDHIEDTTVSDAFVAALRADWLDRPTVRDLPINACGHSLGGAAALILADAIGHPKVRSVHSFGSPKVFTSKQVEKNRFPHYRFVHGCDIIPEYPLGLDHYGDLKRLGPRASTPTSHFFGSMLHLDFEALVSDHRIEKYRDVLCGSTKNILG